MRPWVPYAIGGGALLYLLARFQRGGGLVGLLGGGWDTEPPLLEGEALAPIVEDDGTKKNPTAAVVDVLEAGGKIASVTAVMLSPQPGGVATRGWFSSDYRVEIELRNASATPRRVLLELDIDYDWVIGDDERRRASLGWWDVPPAINGAPGLARVRADVDSGSTRIGAVFAAAAVAAPVRVLVDGVQVSTTWYDVQ